MKRVKTYWEARWTVYNTDPDERNCSRKYEGPTGEAEARLECHRLALSEGTSIRAIGLVEVEIHEEVLETFDKKRSTELFIPPRAAPVDQNHDH